MEVITKLQGASDELISERDITRFITSKLASEHEVTVFSVYWFAENALKFV